MKEYINKQLEEQIGKMIADLAQGNFNQIEQRFGAVENFILRDEKLFLNGIHDEEKSREKEMEEMWKKFVKTIETALEQENTDDKVLGLVQAFNEQQATEQAAIEKYFNDIVESVVSYKRNVIDKGSNHKVEKPHSNPDATPRSTDDMNDFLDKK